MGTIWKFYRNSFAFTIVGLVLAVWLGMVQAGSLVGALPTLWIVIVLSILEISLSFDNAVVNASVLKDIDEKWQRRFLTWGMLFAVLGMRIVFPLAIVAIAASVDPLAALRLSLHDPEGYERIVSSAHVGIAGFGGSFLAMVGLKFFFDADKDVHWIAWVEEKLVRVSALEAMEIACLLLAVWGISLLLPAHESKTFLASSILGIVVYIGVEALGESLSSGGNGVAVVRSGLGGFLYLNVLDASFSFDGVIGAFALSNNMLVIALGLSIGAMFVRSMTIHLVQKGALAQYRYLEHGAYWAILVLAVIMLLSAHVAIPETITGIIGAILIALSFWWSVRHARFEPTSDRSQT